MRWTVVKKQEVTITARPPDVCGYKMEPDRSLALMTTTVGDVSPHLQGGVVTLYCLWLQTSG